MSVLPKQAPEFFHFNTIGKLADLPLPLDQRDSRGPEPDVVVEGFWNGMLEAYFREVLQVGERTEENGCLLSWHPLIYRIPSQMVATAGIYPWTTVRAILDDTPGGALTFRSYLKLPGLPIPDNREVEALRLCNTWNRMRCRPQAALLDLEPAKGGRQVVLSMHLSVGYGTFKFQVFQFVEDSLKGSSEFWAWFLECWHEGEGTIQ